MFIGSEYLFGVKNRVRFFIPNTNSVSIMWPNVSSAWITVRILCALQGATKKTSLSLFENILHQLDNLPEWYTARHLKRQVLNYAVQNRSFLIEEFPKHLEKTNKSYYKIIEDLCIEKNAIGYAADFLIAVCRLGPADTNCHHKALCSKISRPGIQRLHKVNNQHGLLL